jgi:PD-(D/E)XK nuclease superfamily protein
MNDEERDDLNPGEIKKIANDLWNNWVFRLSLSSNELFHSNILQYLAEIAVGNTPDCHDSQEEHAETPVMIEPKTISKQAALKLFEIFLNSRNKSNVEVQKVKAALTNLKDGCRLTIEREWNNLDLVVLVRSGSKPVALFAVEVKIKAYPTKEQLVRYRRKLGEAPLFLLTGMGMEVAGAGVESLGFGELATNLENIKLPKDDPVAPSYIELCKQLDGLFGVLKKNLGPELTMTDSKNIAELLESYRLHAIWWKLWASYIEQQCRQNMEANLDQSWCGLHSYSGFTRTGNLGVCWKWQEPLNSDKPESAISVGVQIEGDSLRLFLNIVDQSLGNKTTSRQIVEDVLLKLCRKEGVFLCNPAITAYQECWNSNREAKYTNGWEDCNQAPDSDWGVFRLGAIGEGRVKDGFVPRLPGYANAHGNGFADFRLTLNRDCTIENIVSDVSGILLANRYSDPIASNVSDAPLLLRVVRAFGGATKKGDWLVNPTLSQMEVLA